MAALVVLNNKWIAVKIEKHQKKRNFEFAHGLGRFWKGCADAAEDRQKPKLLIFVSD